MIGTRLFGGKLFDTKLHNKPIPAPYYNAVTNDSVRILVALKSVHNAIKSTPHFTFVTPLWRTSFITKGIKERCKFRQYYLSTFVEPLSDDGERLSNGIKGET